mgnify:CR=1 FL=1
MLDAEKKVIHDRWEDDMRNYNRDLDFAKLAFIDGLDASFTDHLNKQRYISLDVNSFLNSQLSTIVKNDAKELDKNCCYIKNNAIFFKRKEEEALQNALEGFVVARSREDAPMCGMDQYTLDYLLAQLYFHFGKYDEAGRLVTGILQSHNAPSLIRRKVQDLKEQVVAELKKRWMG